MANLNFSATKELRKANGSLATRTLRWNHDLDRKQYWRLEKGSNLTMKSLIRVLEIHQKDLSEFFTELSELKPKKQKAE